MALQSRLDSAVDPFGLPTLVEFLVPPTTLLLCVITPLGLLELLVKFLVPSSAELSLIELSSVDISVVLVHLLVNDDSIADDELDSCNKQLMTVLSRPLSFIKLAVSLDS